MAEVQTSLIRYRSAIVAQIRFAVFAVVFDFAVHISFLIWRPMLLCLIADGALVVVLRARYRALRAQTARYRAP